MALTAGDSAIFWNDYLGTEKLLTAETKNVLHHFDTPFPYEWILYSYGGGLMKKEYPKSENETESDW